MAAKFDGLNIWVCIIIGMAVGPLVAVLRAGNTLHQNERITHKAQEVAVSPTPASSWVS